jgi:hypothetical protein
MNESNFFKPENNSNKQPIAIETALDLKIEKLIDRQDKILDDLDKAIEVVDLLKRMDELEAVKLEKENVVKLLQEYKHNALKLDEIDAKYKQRSAHHLKVELRNEGINPDTFLKAVFEGNDDKVE